MMLNKFWLIFVSLFLLFSCKSFDKGNAEMTSIALQRGGCYGECPIYNVSFNKDGTIIYNGKMFVENIGRYRVEKKFDFNLLRELVIEADFFNLEDEYLSAITDVPTVKVIVNTSKGSKTISENGQGPNELKRIQLTLDSIINKTNPKDWKSIK